VQADWSSVLQTLEGHSDWVNSVAFSLDGKQIVSGSYDETVLWDAATGAALQTLNDYSDPTRSVAFLPDGNISPTQIASSNWVKEGESHLVWLPPVYRAICQAVWNETIVLGHSSGSISIFGFKGGLKLI
jgi:WD40 repeat protein